MPGTSSTCPSRSMKTHAGPLTMISEMAGSLISLSIGRRNGRITSKLMASPYNSNLAVRQLREIGFVGIEVVRFQIAIGRRQRIHPVVGEYDGLRVLQLGKYLRFEHPIALQVV